jgi:dTDP-glucose pyrophosphorylase
MRVIEDVSPFCVSELGLTFRVALAAIERGGQKIALILTESGDLVGLMTDGDVRRSLLNGSSLDDSAQSAININPLCCEPESLDQAKIQAIREGLDRVVLGRVGSPPKGVYVLDSVPVLDKAPPALIMAGGKGVRLLPLTIDTPKPLIPVAGTPIIHRILTSLASQGFTEIFISVNYLQEKIRDSIEDGSKFGLTVKYLVEEIPMGTAGAIGLLPKSGFPNGLLVMNADLVVDIDFASLVIEHLKSTNDLTMAVREHQTHVPFGVVRTTGSRVDEVVEKPTHSDLISAGVYCLSSNAVESVSSSPLDMPDLINQCIDRDMKAGVFQIHSNWIDIGSPEDLKRANNQVGQRSNA